MVSKTVYNTDWDNSIMGSFFIVKPFWMLAGGGQEQVKIIRVLNTNAVVSVDSQGMELIMTGPGIGFKKRKGENIDQSLVDKTYHLENKEESKL